MRTLSQTIKDVLASDYGQTKDVVIIELPAQTGATPYPAVTLYLANGDGVFIDGVPYENKLRSVSSIKFSLGKAPDGAEFTIENVSLSLGFTLTDFQRALDGAKVTIRRAFKTSASTWEPDTMFVGYIKDVKINQQEIAVTVTSDMSRRGTSVAGVTLTQRCLLKFNAYGSGGPICGWMVTQPGNISFCDKGLDTENGCKSHGNQHRFGGVPSFTSVGSGNGYDTGGGGWGGGPGGGWCIALDSFVLCEIDGIKCWKLASDLQSGDYLISVDKFGRYVPTRVVKTTVGETTTLYTISTASGYSLSCSPTHEIMMDVSHERGTPVNTLKVGCYISVYDFETHTNFKDMVESVEKVQRDTNVLLVELEEPYHLFITGKNKNGAIISHNLKPHNGGDINWEPVQLPMIM